MNHRHRLSIPSLEGADDLAKMTQDEKIKILLAQLPGDPEDQDDEEISEIIKLIKTDVEDFRPNSIQAIVTGTFILWICWFFFNAGSTYGTVNPRNGSKPELIMMNTILSASSSGITAVFIKHKILGTKSGLRFKYDVQALCNGILIGLVSVTA